MLRRVSSTLLSCQGERFGEVIESAYSVRRASIGSIFAARRQGSEVAMTAVMAKIAMTGRMTDRSVGLVL
jgi:hypothetical protein